MQFGILTVGDVTQDPATGRAPTEHERIKAMVAIAQKAGEIGLDVFATGERHNRPTCPTPPPMPRCSPLATPRTPPRR